MYVGMRVHVASMRVFMSMANQNQTWNMKSTNKNENLILFIIVEQQEFHIKGKKEECKRANAIELNINNK